MGKQTWVLIVAGSPKGADSQSVTFGLAVRKDGLKQLAENENK
jgi:hypothetical protein